MTKKLLGASLMLLLMACSKKYHVTQSMEACGCNCTNPKFLSQEYFPPMYLVAEGNFSQQSLTLAEILKFTKAKKGDDISIQNLKWDIKNGKRISAVYDLVKCGK
jgi:hypothetical protein